MALADILERVRSILYSSAIGERPPLRIAASNANESVTGPLVTFTLSSGEGAKVKAGHILSVRGASALTDAFVVYVTSVSTDTVTAVNGYEGPDVTGSDSGDLDNAVLEQNAPLSFTEHALMKHVEHVMGALLYPYVFRLDNESVTPDLSDDQVAVPATVEKIRSAWQVISGEAVQIPFDLQKDLPTAIASTTSLAFLGAFDSSTVHLIVEEKYLSTDSDIPDDIEYMIAVGVAALALGGDVAASNRAGASKDSQRRGERDVSASLWRDFLTLRQAKADELAEDVEYFEIVR